MPNSGAIRALDRFNLMQCRPFKPVPSNTSPCHAIRSSPCNTDTPSKPAAADGAPSTTAPSDHNQSSIDRVRPGPSAGPVGGSPVPAAGSWISPPRRKLPASAKPLAPAQWADRCVTLGATPQILELEVDHRYGQPLGTEG